MAINDISLTTGMRSNLLSLQGTVDLLNRTQNRLSTGKKVNSAMDNPVSFFASQALTSRASVIDSLKDAMGQAVQTITAADKGITAISSMIEQAKGIAQSALSATAGGVYDTETVTLNTIAAGDTIQIGATVLTAGPSGVATTTSLTSQTITVTSNNHLEANDTISIGGLTFTAKDATSTAVSTIALDMNSNSLVAGNTVSVGGVAYTAVASTSSTTYDNYALNLHNTAVGDQFTVGGAAYTAVASTYATSYDTYTMNLAGVQANNTVIVNGATYTAVASVATTTYNHFTVDFTSIVAGDTVTVGGHSYMATAAAVAGVDEFSLNAGIAAGIDELKALIATDSPADFGTSGVTGNAFDITGADGNTLVLADVSSSRAGAVAADTTVTTNTAGLDQFKIGTTNADTADNLRTAIAARQTGLYTLNAPGSATITFALTSGDKTALAANSVRLGVTAGSTSTMSANTTTQVDNTVATATQFVLQTTDALTAAALKAKIDAHQSGIYSIAQGAGTNGNNLLTFTAGAGQAALSATSVQITTNVGSATISGAQTAHDTTTVGANQFVISGDAGMDASNLRAKIVALQSAQYTATVSGGTITIVGNASTLAAGTVVATAAAGAISTSSTTSAVTLGQFEFGIGADANATAANLASKAHAFFGAQLGVANSSGSNVITISSGTTTLSATTVQAGTADATELTIASVNTVTTADAYGAGYFAVTGNNTTDAATISNLINNTAAITGAHYSATASDGVLSIANSAANVTAGNVLVSDATKMVEATVAASSELGSLQNQYTEMMNQIDTLAADSGYKGKNLLDSSLLSVKFEGDHQLDVQGFDASSSGLGIGAATWTAGGSISGDITKLDAAKVTLQSQSSKLSGNLSIITVRQSFSTNMINTLSAGSDLLVQADTNEEGANMLMLQTRQSLSTTALSLSAQAAQSVLKLFG